MVDDHAAQRAVDERRQDKEELATAARAEGLPAFASLDASGPHVAPVMRDVHRFVGATPAMLVLVQTDDLSAETVAQNLPGTDRERPNWRRKVGVIASDLWHTDIGLAAAADFAPARGRKDDDGSI
jgi:glycogen operon protein